jgi:hypothetical protein
MVQAPSVIFPRNHHGEVRFQLSVHYLNPCRSRRSTLPIRIDITKVPFPVTSEGSLLDASATGLL